MAPLAVRMATTWRYVRVRLGSGGWPARDGRVTVMVTANHYLLDGVAGAVCVAAALAITMRTMRADRPWEVRRVPAPAI